MNIAFLELIKCNREQLVELISTHNTITVSFTDDINIDKHTEFISELFSIETQFFVENNISHYFHFDIKSLTFEKKKQLFKLFLNNLQISNPIILLNIISFLRVYNDFAEDFFKLDTIYINDITEFLDLKLELKEEFEAFVTELTKWYYSIFKCVHKVEFNFLENMQKMPIVFERIITTNDFTTLSGIISKSKNFNFSDLYLVENAAIYLGVITQKMNISASFMKFFELNQSK